MEAAGLGVGVIGLVGLFSTCIDVLERWDAYKDFGFESGSMRARFIADRVRFKQWGKSVGIDQGQTGLDCHPALKDASVRSAVDIILQSIKNIDNDAKKYASYLGDFSDSANTLSAGNSVVPDGRIHIGKVPSTLSRRDRLGWALRGKARTLTLVGSFEIIVQKLYDLVPPGQGHVQGRPAAEGQNQTAASIGCVNDWQSNVQKILLDLETQIHNESRREIRNWLDAPDAKRTYDDFILRRLEGTCNWIFNRSEFYRWQSLAPGSPRILWINGPPGYGKTILCGRIIEHLSADPQICVSYFFFSSEIESRANPFVVIRSWVMQLLTQAQPAFDLTRDKWEATDGHTASQIEVKELFNSLIRNLPPCIFVVDGLDECAEPGNAADLDHQRNFLDFFASLTSAISGSESRVLIVSRNDFRIREGLGFDNHKMKSESIELQIYPKDVEADASAFSQSIVSRKLSNKSEAQQESLASRLVDRCESMFLAIKLLESDLRGGKNLKQLQRAIDEAPNRLDHIYDRNWERIQHLEDSSRRRALSILRWATFAVRPLTVLELTECLLIPDEEDDEIDYEELPDLIDGTYVKTEILELCGSLIETRLEPHATWDHSTIHLTHFSVKQYVLCHMPLNLSELLINEKLRSSNEAMQNNLLAKYCLRYLNFDRTWKEPPTEMSDSTTIHAFREYSVRWWYLHIGRGVRNTEETFQLINAFFRPPNPKWELWRKYACDILDHKWLLYDDRENETGNPLLYASLLELTETVDYLLHEVRLKVNDDRSSNPTALLTMFSMNHETDTMQLVEEVANLNIGQRVGPAPLHPAAYFGNVDIMTLLLKAGADPAIQLEPNWTSLHLASYRGNTEVIRLLFAEGVRLGVPPYDGPGPLILAVEHGHAQTVQLLLENGANLHDVTSRCWTALDVACSHGHVEIARLLLERGADVSATAEDGWTPLALTSYEGYLELARLLLEKGAHIDARTSDGATPLALASRRGHASIVELLVEHEADICVPTTNGWKPLDLASRSGYAEIAKLLLDHGADINEVGPDGFTPLGFASENGDTQMLDLLLNKGAQLHTVGSNGLTPLTLASRRGNVEAAKLLLDKGADPAVSTKFKKPAIIIAAGFGHIDLIKLFVDYGHSAESSDYAGRSLLSYAAQFDQPELAKYLLQLGANPHRKDVVGRSPLFYATLSKKAAVFNLILSSHTFDSPEITSIINARDAFGTTLFSLVVRHGHADLVKRLLLCQGIHLDSKDNFGRPVSFWARTPEILQDITKTAARRGISLEIPDHTLIVYPPGTLTRIGCDICTLGIAQQKDYYHCGTCASGDFDICGDCFALGASCPGESHELVKKVG